MIIPKFIGALIRYIYESFRGNREPFENYFTADEKKENNSLNLKMGIFFFNNYNWSNNCHINAVKKK